MRLLGVGNNSAVKLSQLVYEQYRKSSLDAKTRRRHRSPSCAFYRYLVQVH